jgi:hypothetical protein
MFINIYNMLVKKYFDQSRKATCRHRKSPNELVTTDFEAGIVVSTISKRKHERFDIEALDRRTKDISLPSNVTVFKQNVLIESKNFYIKVKHFDIIHRLHLCGKK